MKQIQRWVFALGVLAVGSANAAVHLTDRQEDAGELGDTLQYAIPAAALAFTFLLQADEDSEPGDFDSAKLLHMNGSPLHDFALALGRTIVVTQVLKYTVHEDRPDGGSHSFPSGHTSIAFAGAEFIRKEYGLWWGIPAYAAASYVGWSRVDSGAHHTRDVLAGAAIGILANHDWGEKRTRNGQWTLVPTLIAAPGNPAAVAASPTHIAIGLHFNWQF